MSCLNNSSSINQMFIIEPMTVSGDTSIISACTAVYTNTIISCSGDAEIELLFGQTVFNTSIIPRYDAIIDLGIPLQRFRDINTVSGTSTVWTSTISVTTPLLDLGLDLMGNLRQITADNSIVEDDFLNGGIY
jgi:hypothetical protein